MTTETAAPAIGDQIEGGTFAGRIRIGEKIFGIVIAPKAQGESENCWLEKAKAVDGADSFFDGQANTAAMARAGSPMAKWAQGLGIEGHQDWYIPSRDELELIYRHFKPTTHSNWRSRGDNPSSVPPGYAYRDGAPAQTAHEAFREGAAEAMADEWYWSSTQDSADWAWRQGFGSGGQISHGESFQGRVRAVRRFLID